MKKLNNALLITMFAALVITGCKKEDPDPPVVNNNNNNECPEGMTGPDCETELRAQYIGEYEGEQEVTGESDVNTYDVVVNITASAEDVSKIEIESIINILGVESTMSATGIVNDNGFTIPEHTSTQDVFGIVIVTTSSGSGNLDGTTLTINEEAEVTIDSGDPSYSTSVTTAEKQ